MLDDGQPIDGLLGVLASVHIDNEAALVKLGREPPLRH
jgi:hypothetical protein